MYTLLQHVKNMLCYISFFSLKNWIFIPINSSGTKANSMTLLPSAPQLMSIQMWFSFVSLVKYRISLLVKEYGLQRLGM